MKVPYNWLREYVDIPYPPAELAHRLTMAGIEVGAINIFAPLHKKLVAGRVLEKQKHLRAENLQVVKVDAGRESLSIVCGAWNIKIGDMVALALPGAILPNGREIQTTEIKGVASAGMLCSAGELGLDLVQDEEGILIITEKCSPGDRLIDVLFVQEPVLELDLTPNRGDCLGLLGVAREIAAQAGVEIKFPPAEVEEGGRDIREIAGVEIHEPELCPRYTARVMEGFKIAPSPLNLQLKLLSVGVRAIDNLVDVTNYVMWETGFPMHAFDHAQLEKGRIVVRRARAGETIVTLDGVPRELDPEILVIADDRVPVALAGVMGGEDTEITPSTRRLLLEVAGFNPLNVRRTAQRLNLPSEAAQRYEKGVDFENALRVQDRAAHLMQKVAGGEVYRGVIDEYPRPYEVPRILLRGKKVNEVLGYSVPAEEIEKILSSLGLKAERQREREQEEDASGQGSPAGRAAYTVEIPSFRRDLHLEVDLIEEVARMKGFEHIPATLPRGELVLGRPSRQKRIVDRVREILVSCGLQELITFSFFNPRLFDELGLPPEDGRRRAVHLQNPLTEEQGVLRTILLPNVLKVMQYNFHRQVDDQFLFEAGKIFIPAPEEEKLLPQERMTLALALSGKMPQGDWQNPPRPVDFYCIKGLLDTLLQALGIGDYSWRAEQLPILHPTRGAKLLIGDTAVGFLGELHPTIQEKFDFKQDVYVAELDLVSLFDVVSLVPSFRPLPRFPAVFRDVAFTVPREIAAQDLLQSIEASAGELLEDVTLFDVYEGAQIPSGHRSLAFALTFRHKERTLKDGEIEEVLATIENVFYEKHDALLRKA